MFRRINMAITSYEYRAHAEDNGLVKPTWRRALKSLTSQPFA
jgi:hypothetical protein